MWLFSSFNESVLFLKLLAPPGSCLVIRTSRRAARLAQESGRAGLLFGLERVRLRPKCTHTDMHSAGRGVAPLTFYDEG